MNIIRKNDIRPIKSAGSAFLLKAKCTKVSIPVMNASSQIAMVITSRFLIAVFKKSNERQYCKVIESIKKTVFSTTTGNRIL